MDKEKDGVLTIRPNDLLNGLFVYDERVGCIAVYRRPKLNCLEGIGDVAIYYRHGTWDGNQWNVAEEYLKEAQMVCQALNAWEMIRGAV